MLGVCHKLGQKFGVDAALFQILFVIWFVNSGGSALVVYFLLALFMN